MLLTLNKKRVSVMCIHLPQDMPKVLSAWMSLDVGYHWNHISGLLQHGNSCSWFGCLGQCPTSVQLVWGPGTVLVHSMTHNVPQMLSASKLQPQNSLNACYFF